MFKPARFKAARHAERQDVIGRAGSILFFVRLLALDSCGLAGREDIVVSVRLN
jgi:hypothetical protein